MGGEGGVTFDRLPYSLVRFCTISYVNKFDKNGANISHLYYVEVTRSQGREGKILSVGLTLQTSTLLVSMPTPLRKASLRPLKIHA